MELEPSLYTDNMSDPHKSNNSNNNGTTTAVAARRRKVIDAIYRLECQLRARRQNDTQNKTQIVHFDSNQKAGGGVELFSSLPEVLSSDGTNRGLGNRLGGCCHLAASGATT